jgi:hypothetical protein
VNLHFANRPTRNVRSPDPIFPAKAMQCYHYPDSPLGTPYGAARAPGELPLKDGLYDHPIDALRYFFINHAHPEKTSTRRY